MGGTEMVPEWYTAAIAERPRRIDLALSTGRVHCRTWGDPSDPLLLLLHGGAAHGGWWDHIAPLLGEGRYVVAPDQSGHGDSHRRPAYSISDWAAELLELVGALGAAERTSIVAHSRGGLIATLANQLAPQPFRQLVVVESAYGVKTPPAPRRMDGTVMTPTYPTMDEVVNRFRLLPDEPVPAYVLAHIVADSVVETPDGWTWKFDRAVQGLPSLEIDELESAACPMTLVRSDNGLCSAELYAEAADRLGADQILIPGAGHHILLSCPRELVDVVLPTLTHQREPAQIPLTPRSPDEH